MSRGTTRRTVRVDDETWARWEQYARDAGDTDVSAYLRRRADEPERASKRDVGQLGRELRQVRERTAEHLEAVTGKLVDQVNQIARQLQEAADEMRRRE